MPRRWKSSVDTYTPLTLDEYAIDFAASSVRFKASTVPMSGLTAPARTATPMLDRTRSTRLPGTTRLALIMSSIDDEAITSTSARSPRCRRLGMESVAPPTDPPETTVSVVPDVRSNAGNSSRRGAASAPEVISVSSADCAATVAASANASAAAALALDDVGQRRIVPAHIDAAQRARERHAL